MGSQVQRAISVIAGDLKLSSDPAIQECATLSQSSYLATDEHAQQCEQHNKIAESSHEVADTLEGTPQNFMQLEDVNKRVLDSMTHTGVAQTKAPTTNAGS